MQTALFAQTPTQAGVPVATPTSGQAETKEDVKIPDVQLDALVAPIALYPDELLSQTLVASTYPLELIQLHQWLAKHKELAKDQKKLADAVAKQPWDPSIQAMAILPDVVKWLSEDIQWTTDLGNAFLAQQTDVLAAVQRMRAKAKDKGTLLSNDKIKVEDHAVEGKEIIVIQQANPEVVYVPSYNPYYAYGPMGYPYPGIWYPPYYGSVWAGAVIGFGIGIAWGAFWGGGWGWGCGWGGNNNININNNNNFNRNTNIGNGNGNNIGNGNRPSQQPGRGGGGRGDSSWKHNPQHRGGAPYGDRGTANKFGGTARGDSLSNRQANARQQVGRQGGNLPSNRAGGAGVSNRASGAGGGNRAGGAGASNRAGGGGADRVGSRDVSRGGGGNRDAFGGGSRGSKGYNGSSARASSSRGSSSAGSRGGGGGGSRGGGGRRR
jgi:hypothetical protein